MKILVTGAAGQVGHELCRQGAAAGHEIIGMTRTALDITDPTQVEAAIDTHAPAAVINAAAYTAVDAAEDNPALAFAVNAEGPKHLARACVNARIPLLHISTDYVFSGNKTTPYVETDPVDPVSVYGKSKAAGETAVREQQPQHLILRTSWVFSARGNNFVRTMLRLGREREVLHVVNDQAGCPTAASAIAEVLLAIAPKLTDATAGTYHYAQSPATTWYEFANAIFEMAKDHTALTVNTVAPITTAEYPTRARRPMNSVLDCDKLAKTFGAASSPWHEALRQLSVMLAHPCHSRPRQE